jgi:hypothetical protein
VVAAVSGYTGGTTSEPTYKQVTAGGTGHYEAVQVTYDPSRVTYAQLAEYYFRTVDPTDPNGQFCDRGESYRTAIFVAGPEQRKAAEAALEGAQKALWSEIVTPGAAGFPLLGGRGLSPGLLQEEQPQIFLLPDPLRARRPPRRGLGQEQEDVLKPENERASRPLGSAGTPSGGTIVSL